MPLLAVRGNGPAGAYGFGAASGKAAAMTAIASNTLGANTTAVTFSSIPGTYDDLMVVIYAAGVLSSQNLYARFNSDVNSNYSGTFIYGNGSSVFSARTTSAASIAVEYGIGIASSTNIFSGLTFHILNYANTSNHKTTLSRHAGDSASSGGTEFAVGLWRSTSAITSIEFRMSNGQMKTGSVFALYGIKKAA